MDLSINHHTIEEAFGNGWELELAPEKLTKLANLFPNAGVIAHSEFEKLDEVFMFDKIRVAVVGLVNRGKTFLLNRLSGKLFEDREDVTTRGISFCYSGNLLLLDTEGRDSPLDKESIDRIANGNKFVPKTPDPNDPSIIDPRIRKKLADQREEERELWFQQIRRAAIIQKSGTRAFLENLILNIAHVLIVVVHELTWQDQQYIEALTVELEKHPKKELIVVHNFRETSTRAKYESLRRKYVFDVYSGTIESISVVGHQKKVDVFVSKVSSVRHVFLCKEDSDIGRDINPLTYTWLLNVCIHKSIRYHNRITFSEKLIVESQNGLCNIFKDVANLWYHVTEDKKLLIKSTLEKKPTCVDFVDHWSEGDETLKWIKNSSWGRLCQEKSVLFDAILNLNTYRSINNQDYHSGKSAFHICCSSLQRVRTLRALLRIPKLDVNFQDFEGNTGIHLAILNNIPKIVEILLNNPQVSINEKNDADLDAFELACQQSSPEIVQLLIKHRKPNIQVGFHHGCQKGNVPVVKWFLKRKTELKLNLDFKFLDSYEEFHQMSPIELASNGGHIRVISLLLKHQLMFFNHIPKQHLFEARMILKNLEIEHAKRVFSEQPPSLKDFTIGEFLGIGAEGAVLECAYKAEKTVNSNSNITKPSIPSGLVLKMTLNFGIPTLELNQHQNEIEILKYLGENPHPHIIRILDDFQDRPTDEMIAQCFHVSVRDTAYRFDDAEEAMIPRSTLFSVLPKYSTNLQRWLDKNRKRCAIQILLRICLEIASGLLFLSKHKIVHRDLKLDNILIDENGHIVISDFGLALRVSQDYSAEVGMYSPKGGNTSHLAPEVLNAKIPGRVDYSKQPSWAFGVLIHEILFGDHPFLTLTANRKSFCYPRGFGEAPNIRVPDWPLGDLVPLTGLDERLIGMLSNLLTLSPDNRMTLEDSFQVLNQVCFLDWDLAFQRKESQFFRYFHPESKFDDQQFHELVQMVVQHCGADSLLSEKFLDAAKRGDLRLQSYALLAGYRESTTLGKTILEKLFNPQVLETDFPPFTGFLISFVKHHNRVLSSSGTFNQCLWSFFALGVCYENGTGVAKDFNEAVRLYSLAAKQGYAQAQARLDNITN